MSQPSEYPCVYRGDEVAVYKLSERLYFRKGSLSGRGQCNGAYVLHGGGVIVLDAPTPEGAREMEAEASALFHRPVSHVIVTHGHDDHIGGIGCFAGKPLTIFSSGRLAETLREQFPQASATMTGVENRVELALDTGRLTLLAMNFTMHSPEDLLVWLPEEGVLCTGDTVVEGNILYYHDADVRGWIRGLRRLADWPVRRILPGHGGLFPPGYIEETAAYLETLHREASACLLNLKAGGALRDMGPEALDAVVQAWLEHDTDNVRTIQRVAGAAVMRQFRMVLRKLIYRELK